MARADDSPFTCATAPETRRLQIPGRNQGRRISESARKQLFMSLAS